MFEKHSENISKFLQHFNVYTHLIYPATKKSPAYQ